jgi:hypothetical protein
MRRTGCLHWFSPRACPCSSKSIAELSQEIREIYISVNRYCGCKHSKTLKLRKRIIQPHILLVYMRLSKFASARRIRGMSPAASAAVRVSSISAPSVQLPFKIVALPSAERGAPPNFQPTWQLETDPAHTSAVEIRCVAESTNRPRVEWEHRHLERHQSLGVRSVQTPSSASKPRASAACVQSSTASTRRPTSRFARS